MLMVPSTFNLRSGPRASQPDLPSQNVADLAQLSSRGVGEPVHFGGITHSAGKRTILVSARILDRGLVLLFYFAGGSNLAKMPVHKLLYVRHTVEFQQLHVLFHPPVQRHAHLPRTGVDLGIVDRIEHQPIMVSAWRVLLS
jgi:hypothetical protein